MYGIPSNGPLHIIGVPEGEEREKGAESLFEKIMAKKFPNLGKRINIQIQLG